MLISSLPREKGPLLSQRILNRSYNKSVYSYHHIQMFQIIQQFFGNFIQLGKMQEKKTNKHNLAGPGGGGGPNQDFANGNLDGNKGWFQRLEEDAKQTVFNVMYILLKDSDISITKLSILLFIEFLQMLQYAFSENFKSVWKGDGVLYYIATFLNFTHIEPWMSKVTLEAYVAIFYVCVGVVSVTMSAFIFVAYQAQNQRNTFLWPQQILRQICIVTSTILFLPSLELFTSMLVCVEGAKDGVSVHYIFKEDFQCWTGIHILHASIAIIGSIAYVLISFLITLTFYKNLYTETDASAKTDSKADVQRLIQKVIVVHVFSFLYDESQQWFVIVLYFVLSALTFERYFHLRSYHNESVQLQHNVYRAVCLWSNVAILISKLLQNTSYNGGLQLFLLGAPLVIALTVFNRDQRKQEMMYNITKFQRGDEIARQIKFFLQVIHKKEAGDRNANILLNGFVYLHEDNCPNNQCQLKLYKRNISLLWAQKGSKSKPGNQSSIQKHLQMSQKMDNYQLLLQHAKNMFRVGIQKFPNCPALRIAYSFFLIEKLNKKQEAIQELNNASHLHPTFDEEFVIFRHKRLSEEFFEEQSLTGDKAQGGNQANAVDLMTRFAFESTFRQLQAQIENCAQFHMEFWNHLKDDRPDLGKLGECGSKITNVIVLVDQLWNELMKLNQNAPKAMKLYGRYQIEILQDRESGQELLQRAKEFANQKQNLLQGGMEGSTDIHQISGDGTPCIFVSGEPDKLGNVTQTNSGAVRVFGYQTFEMRNQKVERLMPEMYSKNHQKILEEALLKGPENIPNKERLVFARHKSGYIFPVWLQLKLIQSLQTEIQFVALFKIDKRITNSNIGFVLLNKEKKIQGISSSCIKLMGGLDLNMMRKIYVAGYDISKMAPEIESRRDEIMASKSGLVVEWNVPFIQKRRLPQAADILKKGSINKKGIEEKRGTQISHDLKKSTDVQSNQIVKKKFKFICQIVPIVMGNFGEIGNYIRLDIYKGEQATSQNNYKNLYFQKKKDTIKQPLFQFDFDVYTGKFIRELRDSTKQSKIPWGKNPQYLDDDLNKQSTNESSGKETAKGAVPDATDPQTTADGEGQEATLETPGGVDIASVQSGLSVSHQVHHHHQEDFYARKKRWGKDILIYSLVEGKVQLKDQIDEEKRMMELEDQKRRKREEEEKNLMELANFSNNIKSKQALKNALIESAQSKAIRNLKFTMNVVILFLLALAISEFTVISGQFQEINENFGIIEKSYMRISEIQRITYDVRTLILINEGKLLNAQSYLSPKVPDIKQFIKQDIETALNSLYELQDKISLSQLSLSAEHQKMIDYKLVPLYFLEQRQALKVINFTLTESELQLSSAIFTVRHLPFDRFLESQEDIFFVTYNSFNDFLSALEISSRYLEDELYTRSSEKNDLLLTLFISSLVIIVLSIPILFPAVNSVNKSKDRVLALFIEIPNNLITDMGTRCEVFLGSFYSQEQQEDEVKSEDIDSLKDGGQKGDETQTSQMGSKRQIAKQPRNTSNSSKHFFIQFTIVVVLAIAYFTAMFVIAQTYLDSIIIVTKELSILASNEARLQFIQNTQRELIYNRDKKIYNQSSFTVSKEDLRMVGHYIQEYLDLHQSNRQYHFEAYSTLYDSLMNTELCKHSQLFKLDLIPVDCSFLFNQGTIHGLQTVLIMYLDLLRESLTNYQNATNQAMGFRNITLQQQALRNASNQLINSETFRQLYWMQRNFIQTAFRKLIDTLRETTQLGFESRVNTKMALFIVFIIALVIGYMLIWSPFVSRLSKDILRTKLMLTIIPIHIIMKIPKIQEFLNKQARHGGGKAGGSGPKETQRGHQTHSNSNK